jgi:hypothetical protein
MTGQPTVRRGFGSKIKTFFFNVKFYDFQTRYKIINCVRTNGTNYQNGIHHSTSVQIQPQKFIFNHFMCVHEKNINYKRKNDFGIA